MASQLDNVPYYNQHHQQQRPVVAADSASGERNKGLGLASSIWAPQPSESHWSKAIDSLTRSAERDSVPAATTTAASAATPVPSSTSQPMIRREEVFPLPAALRSSTVNGKDVGAIGDGRKKLVGDFDDAHVGQLLRTLNLTSPEPPRPALNLSFDSPYPSTPDFSPASVSSALLTPTDLSPAIPARPFGEYSKLNSAYDLSSAGTVPGHPVAAVAQLNFGGHGFFGDSDSPIRLHPPSSSDTIYPSAAQPAFYQQSLAPQSNAAISHSIPPSSQLSLPTSAANPQGGYPFFEPFGEQSSPVSPTRALYHSPSTPVKNHPSLYSSPTPPRRLDANHRGPLMDLGYPQIPLPPLNGTPDWCKREENSNGGSPLGFPVSPETPSRSTFGQQQSSPGQSSPASPHEPINFLSLLHPSSSPPYASFVSRIIKSSDQQASIFLQQKLKVADSNERAKIVDAICARGFEMMAHRFGNWAVQRCLEAASSVEERRKIVTCMRGRIVELATNCYGCHVLQKALDCEEDIRLLIVSELLHGDPAQTLVNKHASHVWSKIMELSWTPPAPPIFAYVNNSLKGKWASLACHETGSLVVQHAFENLEDQAKDGIVEELLSSGPVVFSDVAKNQWGSYCIQHILEHGSEKHRQMTLDHLLNGLLEFAINEQGSKSLNKAIKEGGQEVLDRIVKRMCEPARGARRPMIVDMALSSTGSQLIAGVLPSADKDQRTTLYDCIRGHIVTLRGCKTGSKVIWLFDRMRAYYGY